MNQTFKMALSSLRAIVLLWTLGLSFTTYAANPYGAGMTTLMIEYKATPANRPALYSYMQEQGLDQLEQWKRDGKLKDFKVLFSRYVDNQAWDMLTVVSFTDTAQAGRWKEIERRQPAGLPPKALALVQSIDSNPADQWFEGGKSTRNGVYLVIPYDYLISTEQYVSYLEGYVLPQLSGWLADGALSRYNVFLGRYAVSRSWSSLLILEYNGEEGLAARERTTQQVRAGLTASNPTWLEWSKDKSKIRTARQYILADELRKP